MDRKLVFSFYGNDVSAGRTMNNLAGSTDTLRSRSVRAAKAVGALAGGAALAGLTATLKTGFRELQDYEGGLSQLRAGLKSTKGASHTTVKSLENLASSIQEYSGQTDDSIVKTEALLLTFPDIRNEAGKSNKIFDETVKIAADMAARMGTDAPSAAVKLGKALNDPAKGLTALTRVGVVFTDQQANTVKKLQESGDKIGAQKIILHELNKEFGGSAKLFGQSLPGQIERTKRKFEDVSQELADDLLPYALQFTGWLRDDALPALEDFGGWVKDHKKQLEWFAGIVGGLAVGFKAFKGIRSIQSLVGRGPLAGGGILAGAKPLPVYVTNWGGGAGVMGGPGGPAGSRLGRAARTIGKAAIVITAADIVAKSISGKSLTQIPGLVGGYNTAKNLGKYAPGGSIYEGASSRQQSALEKLFPQGQAAAVAGMKGDYAPAIQAIKDFKAAYDKAGLKDLNHLLGVHRDKAKDAAGGLRDLAAAGDPLATMYLNTDRAARVAARSLGAVDRALHEAARDARDTGGDIIGGLIQGLHDRIPELEQEAKYVAATTIKHMRLEAQAESPSKKTIALGKDLADGLYKGYFDEKVWDKFSVHTKHGLMQLSRDVQAAQAYYKEIRSSLIGYAGISGMEGQTDSLGASGGTPNVRAYLRQRVHDLKRFAHLLKRLDKMGLDRALLRQFAQAGPDAIPAMEELIASGEHGVAVADRLENRIQKYAGKVAGFATNDQYGTQIHNDLERLPDKIGRAVARHIKHVKVHLDTNYFDHFQGMKVWQS